MTIQHSQVPLGNVHVPYNFQYVDAAAREAVLPSAFDAEDIGKLARQEDDNSLWMLTSIDPAVVWMRVGGSAAADIGYDTTFGSSLTPPLWGTSNPATTQEAVDRVAFVLYKHFGNVSIPVLP